MTHEKNKSLREALLGILKVITQNTNLLKRGNEATDRDKKGFYEKNTSQQIIPLQNLKLHERQ